MRGEHPGSKKYRIELTKPEDTIKGWVSVTGCCGIREKRKGEGEKEGILGRMELR